MSCPCPACSREGQHDPYCEVHLADHEHLDVPPCDCGLRPGSTRELKYAIVDVHCRRDDSN